MKRYRWVLIWFIVLPLITGVSFLKISDRTIKKRRMPIEYIVIHYTANLNPGADAKANARYLQKVERAGTHYCVDDCDIVQCTDEQNVAYAVADRRWFGFIPKPWLDRKIKNNNSLSYEMCLGGGRNDSLIIERTAAMVGWQLIDKGFFKNNVPDLGRVVRHHDVTGKHCPRFYYNDSKWDQTKEDRAFYKFKLLVNKYAIEQLKSRERYLQRMRNIK